MKQESGITLIGLSVTLIVLLILLGITISLVVSESNNNSIIEMAINEAELDVTVEVNEIVSVYYDVIDFGGDYNGRSNPLEANITNVDDYILVELTDFINEYNNSNDNINITLTELEEEIKVKLTYESKSTINSTSSTEIEGTIKDGSIHW